MEIHHAIERPLFDVYKEKKRGRRLHRASSGSSHSSSDEGSENESDSEDDESISVDQNGESQDADVSNIFENAIQNFSTLVRDFNFFDTCD